MCLTAQYGHGSPTVRAQLVERLVQTLSSGHKGYKVVRFQSSASQLIQSRPSDSSLFFLTNDKASPHSIVDIPTLTHTHRSHPCVSLSFTVLLWAGRGFDTPAAEPFKPAFPSPETRCIWRHSVAWGVRLCPHGSQCNNTGLYPSSCDAPANGL